LSKKKGKALPKTEKDWALYRVKLSCSIGKKACEGVSIPSGIDKQSWLFYQLFSALEDMARAMEYGGKHD
jgi:hypothetical protein